MKNKVLNNYIKFFALIFTFTAMLVSFPKEAYSNLATPTWWQNAAPVSQWHYRVPVNIPAGTAVNSTIKIDVNFTTLLTSMNITSAFDSTSPRVLRPNGALSTIQEYNDNIFAGANDATNDGKGEIRFIAEEAGPSTYYIYFDITANGVKGANPQTQINGNFEFSTNGQAQPTGWNNPTKNNAAYDAQIRTSENPTIANDIGTVGNGASPRVVDGTPFTGNFSYLIGARTNNEPNTGTNRVVFTRTITVPASNPGNLTFRYRVQGWDSSTNGNITQYDNFNAVIDGTADTTMVGPAANNYTTFPFSPNYGTAQADNNNSGYGQYNGFDTDTAGVRRPQGGNAAMTIARGSQGWFTVNQSLASYAGQTITLRFSTNHTTLHKTWFHIDDVEWSVVEPTLGNAQGFGVNITSPNNASIFAPSQVMSLTVQSDALIVNPIVRIFNNSNAVVSGDIRLFNDGTRGDAVAGDNIWTNNGTDAANPTYTFPTSLAASNAWYARVFGYDSSVSNIASGNGLISIQGQPNDFTQANFYNIDDQLFSVTNRTNITIVKSSNVLSDPLNGTTNPKRIPGSIVQYNISIINNDIGSNDNNSLFLIDPIPVNTALVVGNIAGAGSGPVAFFNAAESSDLTYSFISLASTADDLEFSNNNATSFVYTPVANGLGVDPTVTHIRIKTQGTIRPKTGAASPGFNVSFNVRVN